MVDDPHTDVSRFSRNDPRTKSQKKRTAKAVRFFATRVTRAYCDWIGKYTLNACWSSAASGADVSSSQNRPVPISAYG